MYAYFSRLSFVWRERLRARFSSLSLALSRSPYFDQDFARFLSAIKIPGKRIGFDFECGMSASLERVLL